MDLTLPNPPSRDAEHSTGALPPSIFNDVIGPVMRGPSSSHCAASVRIGRLARDLMRGEIERVVITFDPESSLATTHDGQGSDMGLFGGLLGWDAVDERLPESAEAIAAAGIEVEIRIAPLANKHPNAYDLEMVGGGEAHRMLAISTGGGMVDVVEIDGAVVSFVGDGFLNRVGGAWRWGLEALPEAERVLRPVLPVLTPLALRVPFLNAVAALIFGRREIMRGLDELAIAYECARGGMAADAVVAEMTKIVWLLKKSIQKGLAGTEYENRILGAQSSRFVAAMEKGRLLDAGLGNLMTAYVSALMEVKSSMGVIVAAPTAGSCGACPGAVLAAADSLGLTDEDAARGMLAAGLVGVFIARGSSFAAEVGGCQAECGAGAAMAAAALVTMRGGSAKEALDAASMALQGMLGLICDPVANRVEAPCLGKNVLAAGNALLCTNMVLAGYDPLIPFDEVVAAHDSVCKMMPSALRCTGKGGLAMTPTALAMQARLPRGC